MKETNIICRKCKEKCEEQTTISPTWFGRFCNEKLIEAICIKCWKKGEKWEKLNNE